MNKVNDSILYSLIQLICNLLPFHINFSDYVISQQNHLGFILLPAWLVYNDASFIYIYIYIYNMVVHVRC